MPLSRVPAFLISPCEIASSTSGSGGALPESSSDTVSRTAHTMRDVELPITTLEPAGEGVVARIQVPKIANALARTKRLLAPVA